jgi:hypothetical protein
VLLIFHLVFRVVLWGITVEVLIAGVVEDTRVGCLGSAITAGATVDWSRLAIIAGVEMGCSGLAMAAGTVDGTDTSGNGS